MIWIWTANSRLRLWSRSLWSRGAGLSRLGLRVGALGAVGFVLGVGIGIGVARDVRAEQLVEAIAAQVGNEVVLDSEVAELAEPIEERMRQMGAPQEEIERVRSQALERLIEGKLLSSVVERLELGATREEIDKAIGGIASENGLSLDQLYQSIASHGLSVDDYRAKIRGEIERSKVVDAMVRSRVRISEEEIRALYDERFANQRSGGEEIAVRHLVVLTEGGPVSRTPGEACGVVEEARRQIVSGELEFAAAAARISDANAETGGDLGWIHRDDLAAWMAQRVDAMTPGELSPVIELPFGCNLLELVDRRPFERVEFEQVEPQLRNMLFQRKTEAEYVSWIEVLRRQAYIERKGAYATGDGSLGG